MGQIASYGLHDIVTRNRNLAPGSVEDFRHVEQRRHTPADQQSGVKRRRVRPEQRVGDPVMPDPPVHDRLDQRVRVLALLDLPPEQLGSGNHRGDLEAWARRRLVAPQEPFQFGAHLRFHVQLVAQRFQLP